MKAVLIWCIGTAVVIMFGLLVQPLAPLFATGLLLAGGAAMVGAICWKGK